jgi:hypothetical protein
MLHCLKINKFLFHIENSRLVFFIYFRPFMVETKIQQSPEILTFNAAFTPERRSANLHT